MKMKNKIISMGLALVLMISAFSTLTPLIASAAETISENYELELSLQKSEKCVEFIEQNFSQVINEYNIAHQNEGIICEATFIEGETPIYMTELNKYGIYLDFDDNNGYLLISEDYNLYEFEAIGELSYLKNIDIAYYNSFDGFMYLDSKTGLLEKYEYVDNTSDYYKSSDIAEFSSEEALFGAAGQEGSGDGHIYDIDSYVAAVYPKYVYQSRYMITDYQWIYQMNTSVYRRITSTGTESEGNCVLNATYSMMNDWFRRGKFQWMPSGITNYTSLVTSDRQYSTYGTSIYDGWTTNTTTRLSNMPTLYLELRNYAIDYGYLPENGMQSKYIVDMVGRVASNRGYTFNIIKTSSFDANVKYQLDTNSACVISVQGSSTYGNHAMGLYGYVKYTYTSGWWIFKTTKDKYFYVVDDGHSYKQGNSNYTYNFAGVNTPVCYFDPNTSAEPSLTFFYLED